VLKEHVEIFQCTDARMAENAARLPTVIALHQKAGVQEEEGGGGKVAGRERPPAIIDSDDDDEPDSKRQKKRVSADGGSANVEGGS